MPHMDGAEVCARMADDARLSGISVVMLSGASDLVHAAHVGAPAILAKPVEPEDLFAAVQHYARC